MDVESFRLLVEDKEIKFDTPHIQQRLRNGEHILATIFHIEDSKGNPGDSGRLLATNLRLVWHSLVHAKFNLAIGYGCIANLNTRSVGAKTQHNNRLALFILAVIGSKQFEFLFTDVSSDTGRINAPIFQSVFDLYDLYRRTHLYRDLKLRGAILQNGQLLMLPREQVVNQVDGVWNLSSDQGNLGTFVVTNIRIVWYADANNTFNITLPYIQIASIRVRESKYGLALVMQTAETGGNYILGFRIDPSERLVQIYQEFTALHKIYTENPDFGVQHKDNGQQQQLRDKNEDGINFKCDDFEEIDERQEKEINSKLNTYLAEGGGSGVKEASVAREPVYCKELGFALERIRSGYKLKDLWDVLPQQLLIVEEEEQE